MELPQGRDVVQDFIVAAIEKQGFKASYPVKEGDFVTYKLINKAGCSVASLQLTPHDFNTPLEYACDCLNEKVLDACRAAVLEPAMREVK